jgi:hypothetical protein
VASDPGSDIRLQALRGGETRPLSDWLTIFNLLAVVIDPYTLESGWIIPTAARIFNHYAEADVRCGFVVTADADGAGEFLGPYADQWYVLLDPERAFVGGTGLEHLPALVHLRQDCTLAGVAEGWDPVAWAAVLDVVERDMAWRTQPVLPHPADPGAFAGTPALG